MEIRYKASVVKDLKKLNLETKNRILSKIALDLAQDSDQGQELKGKFRGLLKYRVGNYRVIYTKIPEGVLILRIAHRKWVYKGT